MENAAEALKMAGFVLMFMIALSVSIASFSNARQATDDIVYNLDREMAYIDGDYYYKADSSGNRKVGLETIIPTITRVFNEAYEIHFDFQNGDDEPIYTIISTSGGDPVDVYDINNSSVLNGGNVGKKLFLNAILYGDTTTVINGDAFNKYFEHTVKLPSQSLYERLKGKDITECAGSYLKNPGQENNANEEKIRVIKYVIK